MFERNIGIRLTLLPAFAEATKLIISNIGEINKGLQSINENGKKINVDGLKTLNSELTGLVGAAGAAKAAIESLNGIKITKNVLAALEIGMTGVSSSAKVAKEKIQEVGIQASQTAAVVETQTAEMSKGFFNLGEEIMYAEKAMQKLGLFALPKMNEPIIGMRNLTSEINLAEQAMRKLDSFVPKNLESSILRLNSGLRSMMALTGAQAPLMLGAGGSRYALGGSPQEQIDASRAKMLTSGSWQGNSIVPSGNSGLGRTPYEPGHQYYEGPGAITPYVQDLGRGKWMPNGEQMPPNYGPRPMPNYGGTGVMEAGRGIMRAGDVIQSAGWAAAMNAIMIASVAEPIIKQLIELGNIYQASAEAYQAVGMKPENYAKFNKYIEQASTQYGGTLKENVAAGYTFASSVPALSHIDWNDPKQQAEMGESIKTIIQANIAGGRPTHPLQLEHSVLDILASVVNLGMPMANAKELGNSIKVLTDVFTNVKNKTSTDFELLGSSVRNVGAVAHNMGVAWEDTMAVLALMAEGKYRGSISGTSLKRIMSRQAMDPAQARKMEAVVEHFGGNASMFGPAGQAISPLDFFANIAKFEDQHHLPAKQRGQLEGALSGLYAGAPMGEMIGMARGFGGEAGLKKYRDEVIGGAPGATKKAYETRDEHGKNIAIESQKIQNSALLEADKTFKLIEPDIIKCYQALQRLINAWHGINDPTKKFIVDSAAVIFGITSIVGIGGILIGNYTKLSGTMTLVSGSALKLGEHLMGQAIIFPKLTFGIEKLSQATLGLIPRAFGAASAAAIGFQVAIGPIGWAIEAVIAVGALFALAWSKDWGGIREKVAGFPEFLGGIVGHIQTWLGQVPGYVQNMGKAFVDAWNNMWANVKQSATDAMNGVGNFIHNFRFQKIQGPTIDWSHLLDGMPGMDVSKQFWDKVHSSNAGSDFNRGRNNAIQEDLSAQGQNKYPLIGGLSPSGMPMLHAQAGPIADLGFLGVGADITTPVIKKAVAHHKVLSDAAEAWLVAHSGGNKPAIISAGAAPAVAGGGSGGGTSPVSSIPSAHIASTKPPVNTGASDQEVADAIAALYGGAPKKAKKIASDGFLVLKNETIAQVEDHAAKITHALEKAGAVIHKKWIDILDPKSFKVTRVFGDLAAFKQALGTKDVDKSLQVAHDYLMKIKREIEHKVPINTEKVLSNIAVLYAHAMSDHARNVILQMGDTLANAFHRAGDKIEKTFEEKKKSVEAHLRTVGSAGDKFDLLQQQMGERIPQLGTEPTSKDLKSVISGERAERDALASALLREQEDAKGLAVKYAELTAEINKLNGSSSYEGKIREEKKAELVGVTEAYSAANERIIQQKSVVDTLTVSIHQQTEALKLAKDTWNGLLYNVQQKSFKSLIDQNFKAVADHVQNYFQLQNTITGGNSGARQQANNFANSVFQNLFQGMFDTSATTSLEKIFKKGDKNTGTPAEMKYQEKVDKSNDHLSKIEKNTQYLDPSEMRKSGSGNPMPVAVFDQSGGVDIGTSLLDAQRAILSNTASATYTGGAAKSNSAGGDAAIQTTMQKFQQAAQDISMGMSMLNGLRAGGIGGAMQAGSAALGIAQALNMTPMGQAIVTGSMAILGAIGIGPKHKPGSQPDINDPTYRQLLPNLAGTQQDLNGTMINPESQYSSYLGHQNLAQQLYSFASNSSSMTGMNPDQKKAIQQLKDLSGGSATGLQIASEHEGMITLKSGQKIAVTDFETLLNTNQGLLSQFQNNALQQQQNADRLASSFTSFVTNGPAGFTMPDFVGGGSGAAGITHRMPSPFAGRHSGGASGAPATSPQTVNVQIMPGATIHGATQDVIEAAIKNTIPAIAQAVNGQNYLESRRAGNYVSSNW